MKVTPDSLRRLPSAGLALGLCVVAALALTYWLSVEDRERYLRDRNFRLLQGLASQTDQLLYTHGRVNADGIEAKALDDYRVVAVGEVGTLQVSLRNRANARRPVVQVEKAVPMAVLDGLFESRLAQGAFDTIVLATRDGRVVTAVGRRAAAVRAATLRSLPAGGAPVPPARADPFDGTIAEGAGRIAGEPYRIFVHPCCGSDVASATPNDRPGLIVAGLVEAATFRASKLAVSPVVVLAVVTQLTSRGDGAPRVNV
jgi:hypothetical protein